MRNLGLVVFGMIAILVTVSGVKVVQSNYMLQKQIAALQQANEIAQLKVDNMKLKNKYLETDQYLELAARRHYNKALPGEKLLIVPREIALAHAAPLPEALVAGAATEQASTESQSNWSAWMDFLFNRQNAD